MINMQKTTLGLLSTLGISLMPAFFLPGLCPLLGGCGNSSTGNMPDMHITQHDLSMSISDMSVAMHPDMAVPPPPSDMSPPKLSGYPTDCVAGATAAMVYSNVVSPSCALNNCHGTNFIHWNAGNSATTMRQALVGVPADQAAPMDRIKPSDLNNSYLMYKLLNEQAEVVSEPTAGSQMPLNASMLTHDQLCYFISWILAGAN